MPITTSPSPSSIVDEERICGEDFIFVSTEEQLPSRFVTEPDTARLLDGALEPAADSARNEKLR